MIRASTMSLAVVLSCAETLGSRPPLIILPGLPASLLQYTLNNSAPIPGMDWCSCSTSGWTPLYPPPANVSNGDIGCYLENMILVPAGNDTTSRGFKPMRTNMSTRVVDWGGFSGMVQFDQCIQRFNKSGWVPGVSLRGAPYDFRFPAFGFADTFFSALQNLVESMANATGGTHKVSLWAISDANGVVLAFLQRMSVPWKNRYIARWIADSPLWSGAPLAVMVRECCSATEHVAKGGLLVSSTLKERLLVQFVVGGDGSCANMGCSLLREHCTCATLQRAGVEACFLYAEAVQM
eukprot:m.164768 g.164768  ORF g.164768 m.164768 type:complete len:294 (+) comp18115_c0_seq12:238-1119(+)